jgi:hypothetical protein
MELERNVVIDLYGKKGYWWENYRYLRSMRR